MTAIWYTTIDIDKEDLKFSAAHFTIFSRTERERLHGHNFRVAVSVTAPVGQDGMCFNYQKLKKRVRRLCAELDEYTLLPAESPYLNVAEDDNHYIAKFHEETLYFAKPDTKLLPVRNTTVEEFSRYLLFRLLEDTNFIESEKIRRVELKVSSGPGQWGTACWEDVQA